MLKNILHQLSRSQSSSKIVIRNQIRCMMSKNNRANEATFEITKPYKLHRLDNGPSTNITITRTEAIQLYRQMLTIREIEGVCKGLYKEGLITGYCHLYSGEEGCGVGIKAGLKDKDSVITSYRCHGWAYLMGCSPYAIIAEMMGRSDGTTRGKGGPAHMYTQNFFGGDGIVCAQASLGAGMAFMNKYKNDGGVSVALYGDGASSQGQVFEAMNMAKLWKLPCIFVCENNGFGLGTPVQRTSANLNLYQKGDTIPGIWVDGIDVLSVREAAKFARQMCVEGNGPVLIEADTYLLSGHSILVSAGKQGKQHKDPLSLMEERLLSGSLATDKEIKKIHREITQEIHAAVAKAKEAPEPSINEFGSDVYSKNLEGQFLRGVSYKHKVEHVNLFRP